MTNRAKLALGVAVAVAALAESGCGGAQPVAGTMTKPQPPHAQTDNGTPVAQKLGMACVDTQVKRVSLKAANAHCLRAEADGWSKGVKLAYRKGIKQEIDALSSHGHGSKKRPHGATACPGASGVRQQLGKQPSHASAPGRDASVRHVANPSACT